MNERTTIRASLLLVVVAAFVMGATILANAADGMAKVSVALKWLPQAQFAGYYVAQEKGFYEDEGLHVTILPGGSGSESQDLVAAGAAEFGVIAKPASSAAYTHEIWAMATQE